MEEDSHIYDIRVQGEKAEWEIRISDWKAYMKMVFRAVRLWNYWGTDCAWGREVWGRNIEVQRRLTSEVTDNQWSTQRNLRQRGRRNCLREADLSTERSLAMWKPMMIQEEYPGKVKSWKPVWKELREWRREIENLCNCISVSSYQGGCLIHEARFESSWDKLFNFFLNVNIIQ